MFLLQINALPENLRYRARAISVMAPEDGICMSTGGFLTFVVLAVVMLAAVIVVAVRLMMRPSKL